MIYILTAGEYSDYRVIGVVESDTPLDIDSLTAEFAELSGSAQWPDGYPDDILYERDPLEIEVIERLRARGVLARPPVEDRRLHQGFYSLQQSFIDWLVLEKGCRKVEHIIVNIGNRND